MFFLGKHEQRKLLKHVAFIEEDLGTSKSSNAFNCLPSNYVR